MLRDTRGASSVEYILLAGLVALVVAAGFKLLGGNIARLVDRESDHVGRLEGWSGGAAKVDEGKRSLGAGVASVGEAKTEGGKGAFEGAKDALASSYCVGDQCFALCFEAGTKVATSSGQIAIEALKQGDLVQAPSEDGPVAARVARTFQTPDRELVELELVDSDGASEVLAATPEHPFATLDRGWVRAGDLATGEPLIAASGASLKVGAVLRLGRRGTVYNLEIEGAHAYYVGDRRALVHNDCGDPKPEPPKPPTKEELDKKVDLASELLKEINSAPPGKSVPFIILPKFVSPADVKELEDAQKNLKPTAASIDDYLEKSRKVFAQIDPKKDLLGILPELVLKERESTLSGVVYKLPPGDRPKYERERERARYDLAKIEVTKPGTSPWAVARAKDIIAEFEGKDPSFEKYKAERKELEEKRADIEKDLKKYTGSAPGAPGGGSLTAKRLQADKDALNAKLGRLDLDHERDVLDAAKKKAERVVSAEQAKLKDLQAAKDAAVAAKEPEKAKALDRQIEDTQKKIATADAKATEDAKTAIGDQNVKPLRERADKLWGQLRDYRSQSNVDGRRAEIAKADKDLEGLRRSVDDLEDLIKVYREPLKRDGPRVRYVTRDGKIVPKEEFELKLPGLKALKEQKELELAQRRADLAKIELEDAKAWKKFREAELAAVSAEKRVAELGTPPRNPRAPDYRDLKQAPMIDKYLESIGQKPAPETPLEANLRFHRGEVQKGERLLKEANDAIKPKEDAYEKAKASLDVAKRNVDEAKMNEALAKLQPPPPDPTEDAPADDTRMAKPPKRDEAPDGDFKAPRPSREEKPVKVPELRKEDWDATWDGFTKAVDATNMIPGPARPYVAKFAKTITELSEMLEKWHDKMSDEELKDLDDKVKQLKGLRDDLRTLGVDVDHPALKTLLDGVDALAEVTKQVGHFKVGMREEVVKTLTGLVTLVGKLVQFQNDPAYRDDVKKTLDQLGEMDLGKLGNKLVKDIEKDFEKDPARAAGRITVFIGSFFIPFEDVAAAFLNLGKSALRLGEATNAIVKDVRLITEASELVAKDMSVAARGLEKLADETTKVAKVAETTIEQARMLRLAGKEAEAAAKLADVASKAEAIETVARATKQWEGSAQKAVEALKAAKADAKVIEAAEADLARARAALKKMDDLEKTAANLSKDVKAVSREGSFDKLRQARKGEVNGATGGEPSYKAIAKDLTPAEQAKLDAYVKDLKRIAEGVEKDPLAVAGELKKGDWKFPVSWDEKVEIGESQFARMAKEAEALSKQHKVPYNDALEFVVDEEFAKMLRSKSRYYHDPATNTVHAPSEIEVYGAGKKRPLDMNNPAERLYAQRHARAQVEEFAHGAGSTVRPGEYAPLSPKMHEFKAWLEDPKSLDFLNAKFTPTQLEAMKGHLHEADIAELFKGTQSEAEINRYKIREAYNEWLKQGEPRGSGTSTGGVGVKDARAGAIEGKPLGLVEEYKTIQTGADAPKHYQSDPRWGDLIKDPAQGGQVKPASVREAMSVLEAEEKGIVAKGVRRGTEKIDFYDGAGVPWDVKTPPSPAAGDAWKLKPKWAGDSILEQVRKTDPDGKFVHVLLDTSYMNEGDYAKVMEYVRKNATPEELARISEVTVRWK